MIFILFLRQGSARLSEEWAEKLSSQCNLDPAFLKYVLEELSESCFGDSTRSKKVIEELTLSCKLNEGELRKFISEVSKNCPMDAKKLQKEINKAEGKKEKAFQAIYKTGRSSAVGF